jgi:2-polyprenyl-3-methyl-5-hydroxy-6-metoxy-1,4-benzoquinol methylase
MFQGRAESDGILPYIESSLLESVENSFASIHRSGRTLFLTSIVGLSRFHIDTDRFDVVCLQDHLLGIGDPFHSKGKHFVTATPDALPFKSDVFESVLCLDWLESCPDDVSALAQDELRRSIKGTLFFPIYRGIHSKNCRREWWENRFLQSGFRKHPLSMLIHSYESLTKPSTPITLIFEKITDALLSKYPLAALEKERDLHMDMLRESGPRSDAHLARYQLAAEWAKGAAVIVDAACGLGYGSAILARQFPNARVIGIDNSDFAVAYAQDCFGAFLPNLEFHKADICDLPGVLGSRRCDLLVSFESLEHIADPDRFLDKASGWMRPGAMFVGSVPNLWIDSDGGPGPYHLHIFDFQKFQALIEYCFNTVCFYRQNAEGGVKGACGRILRKLEGKQPSFDDLSNAEWWIAVGQKR